MTEKKYLKLSDIKSYKQAFLLANKVWVIVVKWDYFAKTTIGVQFVNAVDSVSANIAEGFGRYSKKDKVRFYRMAYASLIEALDWNQKAFARKLVNKEDYILILDELKRLPKEINHLINFTNEKLKI